MTRRNGSTALGYSAAVMIPRLRNATTDWAYVDRDLTKYTGRVRCSFGCVLGVLSVGCRWRGAGGQTIGVSVARLGFGLNALGPVAHEIGDMGDEL